MTEKACHGDRSRKMACNIFIYTESRGGRGGEVGGGKAINSQSLFPYWCASSSKTPPPKCSIAYPKSIIDWD